MRQPAKPGGCRWLCVRNGVKSFPEQAWARKPVSAMSSHRQRSEQAGAGAGRARNAEGLCIQLNH